MGHSTSQTRRVIRNTLSNSGGRITGIVVNFLLTPYVLHAVGPTYFSLWVLAQVIVGYGALLDFGIGSALVRAVAQIRAAGDPGQAHRIMATASRLYLVLAMVALLAGGVVAILASRLINLDGLSPRTAAVVIFLGAASFAVNMAGTANTAALRGLQRYDLSNMLIVAGVAMNAVMTILVLENGGGIVWLMALGIPISVVTQLTGALVLARLDGDYRWRWSGGSRAEAGGLARFGSLITIGQLSLLLQKRTGELIIGTFAAVSAVAPYSLAQRLSEIPHTLSDQFIKVLLPVASELNAIDDKQRLRVLYLVSTRVTLALVVPLALIVGMQAADLLEVWVGSEYRDEASLVVILVVASVALTSQWPAGAVLQGADRYGPLAVASLMSGVANVGLSIALIGPFGITGVAIGTLIPTLLEAVGFVLPFAMRELGVASSTLLSTVVLPVAVPAIACAMWLVVADRWIGNPSLLSLAGVSAGAGAVYVIGYVVMPSAVQERQLLRRLLVSGRQGAQE
jgi:O-antigen/teichoic acid export membrane protein